MIVMGVELPTPQHVMTGTGARTVVSAVVWPVALLLACLQCWTARTGASWLAGALIVAWFVVLDRVFGVPQRAWIPRPVQWLLPLAVVAAVVALVAAPHRDTTWWSWQDTAEGLVVVALVVVGVRSDVGYNRMSGTRALDFPLHEGTWRVAEGQTRTLNHHWRVPAQRAALDLVRVGNNRMSHSGLRPKRAVDFFAYGTPVFSPCDAAVIACRDGLESPGPRAHPAGNHVVLEADGVRILLGHFAVGTVCVETGQQVLAGAELARVGNSGNSSEPHLHIHAQRDGQPVRLRFTGLDRRMRRGATMRPGRGRLNAGTPERGTTDR